MSTLLSDMFYIKLAFVYIEIPSHQNTAYCVFVGGLLWTWKGTKSQNYYTMF